MGKIAGTARNVAILFWACALSLVPLTVPNVAAADDTDALAQLPSFRQEDYRQEEGLKLTQNGVSLVSAITRITGQAALAQTVGNLGTCGQEKGIFAWRFYQKTRDQAAFGIVMVVSLDSGTLASGLSRCALGALGGGPDGQAEPVRPCADQGIYTASTGKKYYWLYGATKVSVCGDFRSQIAQKGIDHHSVQPLGGTTSYVSYGPSRPGAVCNSSVVRPGQPGSAGTISVNPPEFESGAGLRTAYRAWIDRYNQSTRQWEYMSIGPWIHLPSAAPVTVWNNIESGYYRVWLQPAWYDVTTNQYVADHSLVQVYQQNGSQYATWYCML